MTLRSKRPRRWLIAMAAGAMLLSACSTDTDAQGAAATESPSDENATDEPAEEVPEDAADAASAELTAVQYGIVGRHAATMPHIVAEELGFYEDAGLDVETVVVGQSAGICQQLIAEALQFGDCALNDTIQAIEEGADLTMAFGLANAPLPYKLIASPDVTSWEDLRGTNIMVGGPLDLTRYFLAEMAEANGLSEDDYSLQFAGSSGDRFAALSAGAVSATMLTIPVDYIALNEGHTDLATLNDYVTGEDYITGGPVVHRSWASDNVDTVKQFFEATARAVEWLYDPSNEGEVLELVGGALEIEPDTMAYAYEQFIAGEYWVSDGSVTDSAVEGVIQSMISLEQLESGDYAPADYYDLSFIE